jgi:hypothetical protein
MGMIPLHADDKSAVTSTRLSLTYKSRRRRLNRERSKGRKKTGKKGENTKRKKRKKKGKA